VSEDRFPPGDDEAGRDLDSDSARADVQRGWEKLASEEIPEAAPQPALEPYDPARSRETVRSLIAAGLLTLIALLSVGAVVLVLLGHGIDDVAKLYGLVVTPVITLTSGVVGFYFGAESRRG
jgi:ferric-dicitrate binding protein FerR (iron transport regulator)